MHGLIFIETVRGPFQERGLNVDDEKRTNLGFANDVAFGAT